MGTTTMRADYVEWTLPTGIIKPPEADSKPTKFYGMTTTRADYTFPKELPPANEHIPLAPPAPFPPAAPARSRGGAA